MLIAFGVTVINLIADYNKNKEPSLKPPPKVEAPVQQPAPADAPRVEAPVAPAPSPEVEPIYDATPVKPPVAPEPN